MNTVPEWRKLLRTKLKKSGMSARAVARLAGVSTSTMSSLLNNEGFKPRIDTLEKVFGVLNINFNFDNDYMTLKKLLVLLAEKSWDTPVTAIQADQILDLIKTASDKPLLDKLLSASSHKAFSKLLESLS